MSTPGSTAVELESAVETRFSSGAVDQHRAAPILVTDSADRGRTWAAPRGLTRPTSYENDPPDWYNCPRVSTLSDGRLIAEKPPLQLCEPSMVELAGGQLACFLRENTGDGQDCHKCVSHDGGQTWTPPVRFPIPACHRPVAAVLKSGRLLITFRLMQGGKGWVGWWTQNFMGALTDVDSALAEKRSDAHTRIFPIAYDRSSEADLGYSGHVQFDDGEIYVATYRLDDAPKAQIRGYSFREEDLVITADG